MTHDALSEIIFFGDGENAFGQNPPAVGMGNGHNAPGLNAP